jgi:type IV secretory pathway TraG/TraD family ATPase VirD4
MPYVQQKLARFAEENAKDSKEVADVLSTATRYTDFVGNETIAQSLEGHVFDFASLKETPGTVSIILPMEHMHTCGRWLSVMIASALHELWRKGRGKVPVVIILDELAQYGSIDILIAAMNAARNFGIILVAMVQQLSDLEVMYGKQSNSFINGASWKIFYSSDDMATRGLVEKLAGTTTVKVPNISFSESKGGSSSTVSYGEHAVPLKSGYEVGLIPPDEFLLKISGLPIIEARRKPYWKCSDLDGKWQPDPYEAAHGQEFET